MSPLSDHKVLPLSTIEPAKRYVPTQGPRYDAAFATRSSFDYQRAVFRSKDHRRDLEEALHRYRQVERKSSPIDLDSKEIWTWEDVLEEMARAQGSYTAAAKGKKGALRKICRKIGDNEPAINPWIDFIPSSSNYLSMLCAALKLIFAVARQMAEIRRQILETFGQVPEIIESANQMRSNFPGDEKLQELVISLHESLLDAINGMIAWLLEKPTKKTIKGLFEGPKSSSFVDDHLSDLKEKNAALRSWVDNLRDQRDGATATSVRRMEPQLAYIRQTGIENKIMIQAGLDSQNGLFRMLTEQCVKAEWNAEKLQSQVQTLTEEVTALKDRPVARVPERYITRSQLLQLLRADESTAVQDRNYMLRQGSRIDPVSQGQAYWLLQSKRFQTWLSSRSSALLLVNGNSASSALERTSAISLLCATLSLSICNAQLAYSIHFFCGQHTLPDDLLSGPAGLVRSLVVQLLAIQDFDFDLRFIDSNNYCDALSLHELDSLCDALQSLIHQLPPSKVLFCMIDGVALYEREQWLHQLDFVVHKLSELTGNAYDNGPQAIFKLLITSPYRSKYIGSQVLPEHRIDVAEDAGKGADSILEREIVFRARRPRYQDLPELEESDDDEDVEY